MSLLAHHFKKDFRRLAPVLAGWVIVLIVQLLLSSWLSTHHGRTTELTIQPFAMVAAFSLGILYFVLMVVLPAWVVLEDPPKGTSAFWLTRPLPRGQLIGEKFCWLGALILAPTLIRTVMMAIAGATPPLLLLAAASSVLATAPTVLAAAAFAVTAETFGQFVITTVLTLIAGGIVSSLVIATTTFVKAAHRLHAGTHTVSFAMTSSDSRMLAVDIAIAAMAAAIVLWRYSRRHARFVVPVLGAAVVASILIPTYWSWDFFRPHPAPAASAAGAPQVEMNIHLRRRRNTVLGNRPVIQAAVAAKELPDGSVAIPAALTGISADDPDGTDAVSLRGPVIVNDQPHAERIAPGALQRALSGVKILNPAPKAPLSLSLPIGIVSSLEHLIKNYENCSGTLSADICRYEITAEIPLRQGARGPWGLHQLEIGRIDSQDSEASVELREGQVRTILADAFEKTSSRRTIAGAGRSRPPFPVFLSGQRRVGPIYLLVNRARNEAVLADSESDEPALSVASYQVDGHNLYFDFSDLPRPPDDAWMKGASLVRVEIAALGTVDLPVHFQAGPDSD